MLKGRFFCGGTLTGCGDMNLKLVQWVREVPNEREHTTTREVPNVRLQREGLRVLSAAWLWHPGVSLHPRPQAPLLKVVPPQVEERRSLSMRRWRCEPGTGTYRGPRRPPRMAENLPLLAK